MAFTSLFVQLPGLFGSDGLIPITVVQDQVKQQTKVTDRFTLIQLVPSILWYSKEINSYIIYIFSGLSHMTAEDNVLHLMIFTGSVLSFLMAIEASNKLLNSFTFLILWVFYTSIFSMSSVFLGYQWDALLLEAGFITIFFAPIIPGIETGGVHVLVKQLIKWLNFRLMVASGLVKLFSECPTWWGLTALHYHFQSQPLPNAISWFAHQLPDWLKRLGVLDTFVVEIIMP